MATEPTRDAVLTIEREECLHLLATRTFGRLAVGLGDGAPVIRPVNYAFDEPSQSVVFRTGDGTKFHALVRGGRDAAFEIDEHDPQLRTGWSVIIVGVASEVTSPSEIVRLERLGVQPYAPAGKHHWVQIRARTVTGRRIVAS
jgi:nitroimidazol reductase NimA-like FMN-containing flavoprotein (pyridoxamine 5'-phosphate oxidase superfamily)